MLLCHFSNHTFDYSSTIKKLFFVNFSYFLILNTKFEIEENMGSKISIQDIDQKASDFAKANFMKQLKEHHQNLEKENKELKEKKQKLEDYVKSLKNEIDYLQNKIDQAATLYRYLKKENKELKEKLEICQEQYRQKQMAEPKELDDK